jgi:hypothetical protein
MSAVTAAFLETGQNGYGAATPPEAGEGAVQKSHSFDVRGARGRCARTKLRKDWAQNDREFSYAETAFHFGRSWLNRRPTPT